MKLNYFALGLEGDDFDMESPTLVSDFNFQTNYISDYIQKRLKKENFEADKFNLIMIRGRQASSDKIILKEHFKSLSIEVLFDKSRYKSLYPYENTYPLENLLQPVKKVEEFNEFLIEMIMQGLEKARKLKAPVPYDFLVDAVLDFKSDRGNNEWVHKSKTFKEYGVKVSLLCRLTVNYFSLELIIEKGAKEVYKNELLRTLPDPILYKRYFKDLKIENGKLIVTKDMYENSPLFELSLSEI